VIIMLRKNLRHAKVLSLTLCYEKAIIVALNAC